MGIRDVIAKARRAQQEHEQKHPVQLEIKEWLTHDFGDYEGRRYCLECDRSVAFVGGCCVFGHVQWASEEEQLERFRYETFTRFELQMLRADMAMHPQDYERNFND